MKKLIYLLTLLVCHNVGALNFKIINASFNDSVPIELGSAQYVDVIQSGGVGGVDSIRIYLMHVNQNMSLSNPMVIFRERFQDDFINRPVLGDGSRRIYFNMPGTYPLGKFSASINAGVEKYSGVLGTPSSINALRYTANEIQEITYYNLSGQITTDLSGIYIRQTIYNDGYIRREKVYFNKHQ